MNPLKTKIDRALAFVHAAIDDPNEESLREANEHATDVLEELDAWSLRPELRDEVAHLATALGTLRHVLARKPMPGDYALALILESHMPDAPASGSAAREPARRAV